MKAMKIIGTGLFFLVLTWPTSVLGGWPPKHVYNISEFDILDMRLGMNLEEVRKIHPTAKPVNCPRECVWMFFKPSEDGTQGVEVRFTREELGKKIYKIIVLYDIPKKNVTISDVTNKVMSKYGFPTDTKKGHRINGERYDRVSVWVDDLYSPSKKLFFRIKDEGDSIMMDLQLIDEDLEETHVSYSEAQKRNKAKSEKKKALDKLKF